MEQENPINLLDCKYNSEYAEKFNLFKAKIKGFTDYNKEFSLKIGDVILFRNGYDVEMITSILGFDDEGLAYLLWDCYWFPINLKERLIKQMM
jgi:hypothetical protein